MGERRRGSFRAKGGSKEGLRDPKGLGSWMGGWGLDEREGDGFRGVVWDGAC